MTNLLILATEEGGDPPNPVIPEINEIFWAAVFFFALWALMKFVLLPPLTKAMEAREETLRGARDGADRAEVDLAKARRNYDDALAGARAEANTMLEQARTDAEEHRARLQAAADAEIADMRRGAQGEIDTARAGAVESLQGDVASIAVGAAGAVLGKDLDVNSQRAVVDQALSE